MRRMKYTSDNGYTGVLYGKSSLAIYDKKGRERMHTGFRNINTFDELKECVDTFPEFEKLLSEKWNAIYNDKDDDDNF